MSFPRNPEELTAEWLSAHVGGQVSGFSLEQIGIGVGILGRLFRVTLAGDGVPGSVIAKFPTLDEAARMNVVGPLGFYANEVAFYANAAADAPVATPHAYFTAFEPETGDFVLLLEDLEGRRIADQTLGCQTADARTAIDAMAALHAHWWSADFTAMPWVKSYADPPYPQVIAGMFKQAWPEALKVLGDHVPARYLAFGERFVDLVPWFMEGTTASPVTFCHGDFRLDNLFFARGADDPPITLVDWQICFRGRAGYDVAYFLTQSLDTETRRAEEAALKDRYLAALADKGVEYDRAEFDIDYARTTAYCFIYPVVAAGQVEAANDRQVQLVQGMAARALAAMDDATSLDILPA